MNISRVAARLLNARDITTMKRIAFSMAGISLLGATLTACGGGGSTSEEPTSPANGPGIIVASQGNANATVESIKDTAQQIAIAATLGGILDHAASLSGTSNCNTLPGPLGNLVDSGSGTMTIGITLNPATNLPGSASVSFANCTYKIGQATFSFDGTAALTYSSYVAANNFVYSVTYINITFSMNSGLLSINDTLTGTETTCTVGMPFTCPYVLNGVRMTGLDGAFTNSAVQVTGTQATNAMGQQFAFTAWNYDIAQPSAIAASVLVTDTSGNTASMTALFGVVTLVDVVNSGSSTFSVTIDD